MPPWLSVASTKLERALSRSPGRMRPEQGGGCAPAPCDRGRETGVHCWKGHLRYSGADGGADGVDDALLLLHGDARPDRHGEVLAREALGLGVRPLVIAEVAQRRLEVERRQVVGRASDPGFLQRRDNAVAVGMARDDEVVHVARLVLGHVDEVSQAEL